MESRKGIKIWIIIIVVVLVISIPGAILTLGIKGMSNGIIGNQSSYETGFNGPYIGVLHIQGAIADVAADPLSGGVSYNHQWTLDELDRLMDDAYNEGLVLFIDSPGGGIYETDELYLKVKEYIEYTGNPVYAAMGSMAASGGYYTAVAAEKVFANRNTLTGSIGVTMGTLYDISGFLDRYGIKATTITSGKNKAMGDMSQPLTVEQKEIFQSISDDAYNQFVGIVAKERNIKVTDMYAIADGRVYTASQALYYGLVDELGTVDDAVWDMSEKYGLEDCYVEDLYYEDNSFLSQLMRLQTNVQIPGELGAVLKLTGKTDLLNDEMPISYMCEFGK